MVEKLLQSGIHLGKKEFRRNDFLKISGRADTNIYFIDKGSIRIFIKPSDLYIQVIKKQR